MKQLFAIIFILLGIIQTKAEIVELASYQDGFGRNRIIKMVLKEDKPSAVIIPCEKEDGSEGFLFQPINYLFAVESYFKEIRDKYTEWTETATSNGVDEYEKKLSASGYLFGFYWFNPERRQGSSELNAVWKLSKDKNIIEATAKVIDTNGSNEIAVFSLTFSSPKEIDMVLDAISKSNIQSHTPQTIDSLFQ